MKLIVGLGNPGIEYTGTRHNAGFMVLDELAARHAQGQTPKGKFQAMTLEAPFPGAGKCLLMKPTTYMNLSGRAVSEAMRFYKLEPSTDLLVISDDTALPVGGMRLRQRGGSGGQKGLGDIERMLATDRYARLRVGVGEPGVMSLSAYVLGKFTEEQRGVMATALGKIADCAEAWARDGAVAAMNAFNVKEDKKKNKKPRGEAAAEKNETTEDTNDSAGADSAAGQTEPKNV